MIKVLSVVMFLASYPVFSQSKTTPLILGSNSITDVTFHIYDPPFRAKPQYRDSTEALNEYPEQLMSSIMSASTQQWVNYNTLGGYKEAEKMKPEDLAARASMNRENNYFELISKLSFKANGSDMAIVKFFLHLEALPVPYAGVTVMQKAANRWYKTSTTFTSPLALFMMRFDEQKLALVLKNERTGEKPLDDLLSKVENGNTVDLDKLVQEFNRWYSENDRANLDFFIDKRAW